MSFFKSYGCRWNRRSVNTGRTNWTCCSFNRVIISLSNFWCSLVIFRNGRIPRSWPNSCM